MAPVSHSGVDEVMVGGERGASVGLEMLSMPVVRIDPDLPRPPTPAGAMPVPTWWPGSG